MYVDYEEYAEDIDDDLLDEEEEEEGDSLYDLLPDGENTADDAVVTTITKNPLIKGRKDPEEKAWEKLMKRVFSSFSGRRATYSFFDVVTDPNTVVQCNDGKSELAIYGSRHVGFHLITFKNEAAARLQILREQLNIRETPGIKLVLGATYLQLRNKFLKGGDKI